MRQRGVCVAPGAWQQRLADLQNRMKVSKPVLLLESCLTQVPLVVGQMRPVILVLLGLLSGLPAEQVELLLMHELAHIRRPDYDQHASDFCQKRDVLQPRGLVDFEPDPRRTRTLL
jgi:hypothetical protein